MKINLKNLLSPAFICLVLTIICTILGTIFYSLTFQAFKYPHDRGLITSSVVAIWLVFVLLISGLFDKDKPFWLGIIYVAVPFAIVFSAIRLLTPSLNAIGVYLSPAGAGMGDVATNSIAVPRCLTGAGFYIVAIISFLVASFFEFNNVVEFNGKKDEEAN